MIAEPRTTADIVSGLLDFVLDRQWSDDVHTTGDYYEKGCSECGALEADGEHRRACLRAAMISEARAFIAAETTPTDHADGDTCPSCSEVLGSPSVCAISHDFRPGAYDGDVPDAVRAFDPADPATQARFKAYVDRPDVAARLANLDGATVTATPGHVWQRDASGESVLVPTPPAEARPDVPDLTPEETADLIAWAPTHLGLTPEAAEMMQAYREGVASATLTREEAEARIRAISPTAVRHLDTARDWLAAYALSGFRDPTRDEMAKILRAYVAGLDAQNGDPR